MKYLIRKCKYKISLSFSLSYTSHYNKRLLTYLLTLAINAYMPEQTVLQEHCEHGRWNNKE